MNLASRFNEVVRDIPSGLPHPDGTQRIQNVGPELGCAGKAGVAIARLNDFVSRDVVPEDLGIQNSRLPQMNTNRTQMACICVHGTCASAFAAEV
jgi:hypothetical protein